MKFRPIGVVGDIGGTHSRFALVDEGGHIRHPKAYQARDHAGLSEVLATYLEDMTPGRCPTLAVLAVAGPVVDGEIEFTNIDWRMSEGELVGTFEFEAARLLNDFAAQALAVANVLGFDRDKLNPNGSGIALGHPVGATGTILTVKAIYELKRIGGRYGLMTMCIGGGQGIAAIFERM